MSTFNPLKYIEGESVVDSTKEETKEFNPALYLKKKDDTGVGSELDSKALSTFTRDEFIKEQLDLQEQAFSTAVINKQPQIDIPKQKPMSMETFQDIAADAAVEQEERIQAEEDKKLFEEFDKKRTKLRKEAQKEEDKEKTKELLSDSPIFKKAPEEIKEKFESGELTQADFHPDGNYFYGYLKNVNKGTSSFFRKINGAEKLIAKGISKASFGTIEETDGIMGDLANWVDEKSVKGLVETPDNVLGGVIGQLGYMNMFPAELMLTPQAKIKALSTVTGGAINGIPKLATLLGVGGGLEEYSQTEDIKSTTTRAVQGFSDGLFLHMLGGLAGTAGQKAFANPLGQNLTASGINALGFGGKSAYEQFTTTGEISGKEVGAAVGLALALSAPEIAKMAETYFTSTKATDRSVANMKVSFKQLEKEYRNLVKEGKKEGITTERKTEIEIAKQGLQNFFSQKLVVDDVKKDPQKYKDIIENDKTLSKKEKKFQLDKIDQIEKMDIKPLEQEIAEMELEQEKKPKYSIKGKEFETKEEFLKEIDKLDVKESENIEVKNDEATTKKVADMLESKINPLEGDIKQEKPKEIEKVAEKKEAVKEAKIEIKEKVEEKQPKKEVQDGVQEVEAETKTEEGKKVKYETKEEFKQDFLSDDVNLNQVDVPLKKSERIAAAKNLREGKKTKQSEILEAYLDDAFEQGNLQVITEAAGGKTTRTNIPLESIIKPTEKESIEAKKVKIPEEELEKQKKEEDSFKEYAKTRVQEDGRKLTPKQAEKTMNARIDLVDEMKLTIELPEEQFKKVKNKPLKNRIASLTKQPSKGTKITVDEGTVLKEKIKAQQKASKEAASFTKKQIKERIKTLTDFINKSKDQKHITTFEHRVIRNKLKNVADGTPSQMKQAVEYAEKIIKDSKFRAEEVEKFNNIKKLEKEIKSLRNKTSKFKTIKRAFNVPEIRELLKEYEGIVKNKELEGLTSSTVKSILEDIQRAKEVAIKEFDKVEKYKATKKEWEKKSLEVAEPVKGWKKGDKEWVEKGETTTTPERATKRRQIHAYDENLTSLFSMIAAKGKSKGDVGRDWLNSEIYHKRLLPSERAYKKFSKDETEKTSKFVKKLYGKDVEVVLNELNRERVELTLDVIDKDGNTIQHKKSISKGEAIKKWMELQDESLHPRIFEPMRVQSDGRAVRGNGFTELTVKELQEALSPKDIKLANKLFEGYQELGKRYRDYFAEQFGITFPEKEFYSNIYSDYMGATDNLGGAVEEMATKSPLGTVRANNTMSRVTNKNRIKDVDALTAYFDYVDKMEWMYQFGEASDMYSTIINNGKFKRAVQLEHGTEVYKALKEYERVINRDFESIDDGLIKVARDLFSGAALGVNPNIAFKQTFSILTAMTEVNPLEFSKRVPQFAVETTAALAGKNNDVAMLAQRPSITGRGRTGLGHDIYLNPSVKRDKVSHIPVLHAAKKIFSKGIDYQTKGIEWVDKGASLMGGYIVFKAKKAQYIKEGMSVKDATEQASMDFDIFVDSTQQSQSMFNTPITRMKAGALGKMAGMFTSAISQFQRHQQNSIRNITTGVTSKGQFKNKKVVKNLATMLIIRQLIPALYQLAADGWEIDEKNQLATAIMGNWAGIFIAGKLAEKAKNTLMGDNYDAQITPAFDNIQRAIQLTADVAEMKQYPELYSQKEIDEKQEAWVDVAGYLTGVSTRGIRIISRGDFKDFFDGKKSDQEKLVLQALKSDGDILDILENEYGEEFVYNDQGNLNPGAKSYVREYIYQEEKDDYGNYADEIDKVRGMYDSRDKVRYLLNKKKSMNSSDFNEMMDDLVHKHTYGSTVDKKTGKRKSIKVGSFISQSVYDKVYEINEDK